MSERWRDVWAWTADAWFFGVLGLMFLPMVLHLALIFPRDRPVLRSSPQVFRWVYGIPAALVIGLLVLGAVPVIGIAFAQSYTTFLFFRLAIGAIGASFVITQYHTSVMFAPNVVCSQR